MQHAPNNPDCVCLDCIKTTRQAALVWLDHCRKKQATVSLDDQIRTVEDFALDYGNINLAAVIATLRWVQKNQERIKETKAE